MRRVDVPVDRTRRGCKLGVTVITAASLWSDVGVPWIGHVSLRRPPEADAGVPVQSVRGGSDSCGNTNLQCTGLDC